MGVVREVVRNLVLVIVCTDNEKPSNMGGFFVSAIYFLALKNGYAHAACEFGLAATRYRAHRLSVTIQQEVKA